MDTTTTKQDTLHRYIDMLNEYQQELVLSFLETLFDLRPDLDLSTNLDG